MNSRKKDSKTIIISFIMLLVSLLVNAAGGQPINITDIGKEVLGVKTPRNKGVCLPNSVYAAKVVKAIDGDTLSIGGSCNDRVRMLYVDTPETVKPNTPVQCYGPEASEHTKKLFNVGDELYMQTDKEAMDRYGRLLAIIYKNKDDTSDFKKSINYKLVQDGYARAKFYSPNIKYKPDLLILEESSRSALKGLWSACN